MQLTSQECELQQHMMIEGFRWSIGSLDHVWTNHSKPEEPGAARGLVARILMRTITEGSTAVMQPAAMA